MDSIQETCEAFRTLPYSQPSVIIKYQMAGKITNIEVLGRAETTSIEAMILKAQLCWTSHVIRMNEDRIHKQLLSSVLSQGHFCIILQKSATLQG